MGVVGRDRRVVRRRDAVPGERESAARGPAAPRGYMPAHHTNERGRVVCEDCNRDYANRRTFLR